MVVAVAGGDHAVRSADAPHLAQCGDGFGDVLQDLVRVHDVERRVRMLERVHVADRELDVAHATPCCRGGRVGDDCGRGVDADHRRGSTRPAMSRVMVPGPQPTSRTDVPATNRDARYAAELSTVRQRWERSTLSSWPWV